MKKFLAVITAICVMLTASITAFAQTQPKSEDVQKEINKIVNYITSQKEGDYTIEDAVDFYYLTMSGADLSKYNDKFIASVSENIKANDGKLVTQYGESLATYAAVISILDYNDFSPWEFEGYDLTEAFSEMPADSEINPYYYYIVIPTAYYVEDENFITDICEYFVDNYYTMGSGMENWGYSCDNTAYFVSAMISNFDFYTTEIEDALSVIETYKTDGGYFCDNQYGTSLNANSTALALMAYANYEWAVYPFDGTGDISKSNEIYSQLAAFKTSTEGAYSYEVGGEPNLYATFDVLRGLTDYYYLVDWDEFIKDLDIWEDPEDPENPDVPKEEQPTKRPSTSSKFEIKPLVPNTDDTTATTAETKKNTSKKSPSTGAGTMTIAFSIALAGAGVAVLSAKKKED